MPKSDTWPGGITMETMAGMDSAGSCDSVVSMNSSHSDDSLKHLSAEEKACLMFLEETIESLSTEEDSGLSNDEPDRLPVPGNVANKMAHLSASMGQSKLYNVSRHTCDQPDREEGKLSEPAYSYLVPTPLVMANISSSLQPKTRPGLEPNKENFHPGSKASFSVTKPRSGQCGVPSEVNVVVVPPPPTKVRGPPGGPEVGFPRGPLSYEALVQLRKSASMKRAPDSPGADPSRDRNKQPSGPTPLQGHHGSSHPTTPSDPHPQKPTRSNPSPPVVAPKPQRMPSSASRSPQDAAAASPTSNSLQSERVRKEALLKLGLLRDSTPEPRLVGASLCPLKSHSYWDLSAHSVLKEPGLSNPGQGHPFSYIQGSREALSKPRPVQSSSSLLLHRSRSEELAAPLSHPLRPSGVKAATLERSGVGLGSHATQQSVPQPLSDALSSQRKAGCGPPVGSSKAPEMVSSSAASAKPGVQKPAQPVGFSVVRVPNMGEDRKQALRKLGLLKD
ncbi:specifically androgen-regulated gene protein [Osmerus eperlanus]|uniref:specifically androgen-regulated gene protein n=1 Tax=Osmerus eperlanus TaxID=29151 RepID=UPI002E11F146